MIVNQNNVIDSSSKSITETLDGSHHFTIRGYSLARGMGPGRYISSDTFIVGGHKWAIYFYPDGKNPEDSSLYVSVFIALASEGTDVRALFELKLLDQSGKEKHKVHSHFDRALVNGPYSLRHRGSMWGYKRFFKKTSLETSDFLKDDSLTMHCTVGVVRTRVEGPKLYSVQIPPSDMGESLKYLLDNELKCDVIFQIGEETFKAHKLILAARSPVFRAQFFGLVGNPKSEKVEFEDIEPSIFKALLHFIYADTLPDFHEIMTWTDLSTSAFTMQHLVAAADRFGLDRLKLLCEAKLCEAISADTVATMLSLAEQHQCIQLKDACLKFSATNLGSAFGFIDTSLCNAPVVMQSEGFQHLKERCPSLLPELLETVASVDANSNVASGKKRSGSSTFGPDLAADGALAEPVNPYTRRLRRRV